MKSTELVVLVVSIAAILMSGYTLVGALDGGETIEPTSRTIYMNALEYKGSTTVDKEPFPSQALPPGGGYALKEPDETGKWVVESYQFAPSVIVAYQGDSVTLKILGSNGAEHAIFVDEYVNPFTLHRGELATKTFIADKVGTFEMVCNTHLPNMVGHLVVLPRP
ncbi:MAG: hypothetical protein ACE5IB_03770 [Candidatus Geothermarchaeales archaeon]